MTKVWIVVQGWEPDEVWGVYTSKKRAEDRVNTLMSDPVASWGGSFWLMEGELDEAARPALDVERLQQCQSLMVLLKRYGRFNEAWWNRLADEYAAARLAPQEPT